MRNWLQKLNNARLLRYLLLFILAWAVSQLLGYFAGVLIVFIFAAIFAFFLNYPVTWLERRMPHSVAAILVFTLALLIVCGILFTLGLIMLSQAQQLIEDAPNKFMTLATDLERLEAYLLQFNLQLDFKAIEAQLRQRAFVGLEFGFVTAQRLLFIFLELIIVAVLTFFMLLDGKPLWRWLLKFLPPRLQERLPSAIQKNFIGFFWGRFLLSVFFGVSVFIIFVILKLPYALVLAAIAGVFDMIPGIGATLGISIVSLIVLPQDLWLSVQVLIGCVLLQQVEENLLMPRVMQGSVNLNPVVLFFALLLGARIAGLIGVFLSIPIAGTLVKLLEIEEMQGH